MIAGEHHDLFETGTPQRSQRHGGICPDWIFQDQSPLHYAVYRDKGAGRSFEERAAMQATEICGRRAALKQPVALSQRDIQPVHPPPDTKSVFLHDAAWKLKLQSSFRGRLENGAGQNMRRDLVERGCEFEQAVGTVLSKRFNIG
jgi:hypothetical protein